MTTQKFTPTAYDDETAFVVRPYLKVDLARLYCPGVSERTALNKFNTWMRHNPELHRQLYGGREGKNDVCFTVRQVRLIVQYLGEP